MEDRGPIIVVDVETNGLDPTIHQAVEVAWWNLDTGERDDFVPSHSVPDVLWSADLKALQVNRYIDRIADRAGELAGEPGAERVVRMLDELAGATLLGSNVRLDAAMIQKLFAPHMRGDSPEPWHYRLWELGPYAAGVLGLDYLPGLAELAKRAGVDEPDHTAAGDVTAAGEVFLWLRQIACGIEPDETHGA